MKMIATKTLRYGTRSLRAGDEFDASPRDARLLQAIGKASAPPAAEPAVPAATLPAVLEPVADEPPAPQDEPWLAAALRKRLEADALAPKRTYKRRDLLSE